MPAVNWNKVIADFDIFIENEGQTVDVLLRDGVTTFSLKMVKRKIPVENMTDGIQQNSEYLSVMASRWWAGAGASRDPEKGDQITYVVDGRRQAIQTSTRALAGDQVIGFRLSVLG
jgi:hypothetical protein